MISRHRPIVNPNSGFRRQLETLERLLQKKEELAEKKELQPWMRAEIIRWRPSEKKLDVVQRHDGSELEKLRGWLTHVGTQVWIYNFRRSAKAVEKAIRSWLGRPKDD